MNIKVYNQKAKETGTLEVPDAVFGLKWNADLVHQVVTSQMANKRAGTAHTKNRGEVSGGGKKPWQQKGTGRARHGSNRSPIWVGGGITHGPRSDKNYTKKINKKMAKKALFTVLSAKARDNELIVIDDLTLSEVKTKNASALIKNFANQEAFQKITKGKGVLVALPESLRPAKRAFRNLPYAGIEEARNVHALEAMRYKFIMIPKDALGVFHM